MGEYHKISVSMDIGKVKLNPTSYKLIEVGTQEAIFKLSYDKCIKVYANKKHKHQEESVLSNAKKSSFFPNLYETRAHFLVMDY